MKHYSPTALALQRLRRHRLAMLSIAVLAGLAVLVSSADLVAALLGVDPNAVDLLNRTAPPSACDRGDLQISSSTPCV